MGHALCFCQWWLQNCSVKSLMKSVGLFELGSLFMCARILETDPQTAL